MECKEAIYSSAVADYMIQDYGTTEELRDTYQPVCFQQVDDKQAIIYLEEKNLTSEVIRQFGYLSVPACYGLMSLSALDATGVLRVRRQPYLDLYGSGTLIGFVDTGIDASLSIFTREDNTTRIVSIWDQTLRDGVTPEGFAYGSEITADEINQAISTGSPSSFLRSVDENGHGTFMAGLAAGKIDIQNNFSGVAPEAEIIMVKCKQAKTLYREYYRIPEEAVCYQENDIMLGVSYLLRKARTLARPIVICIGMGTNMGNHGGNSALGGLITRYGVIPNVCFCVPGGNQGNARHHTNEVLQSSAPYEEIEINVEDNMYGFTAEMWWKSPGSLSVSVVSPSGDTLERVRVMPTLTRMRAFVLEGSLLEIYFGVILEQVRDQVIFFRFEKCKPGIWRIRIYPNTDDRINYHVWLPLEEFMEGPVYFIRSNPDVTICEPGNAVASLTTSAYNSQDNTIYIRGSRGYNVRDEVKPDFAAPGVNVYGAFPGGRFGTMSGTSVASAITGGVSALLFEQFGDYRVSGVSIQELLIQGARNQDIVSPNREWGYGAVDLYETILSRTNIER